MSNTNYLAHFGTKGQKHGLRRHQSYETAPTRSGMVGQEVGEAARQSERLNRRDEQNDRNGPRRGPMQYEAKPSYNSPSDLAKASKRQSLKEKLRAKKAEKDAQDIEKNKAKWAKSYADLEKHKDAFTNKELEYALNRLNLTSRIKSDRWEQTRNLTQKGADTMKNLANASQSFVDIYNVVAGGYNTYQNYKTNKANKIDLMPKWNASSGSYNLNNQNKSNNQQQKKNDNQKKPKTINTRRGRFRGHAGHSDMSAKEYIAHFGIPSQKKFEHSNMSADDYIAHFGVHGQQWFKRHFQSYKTAPTRSGKVGEEIGLAAKQAERLGEEETSDNSWDTKANILSKNGFKKTKDYYGKTRDDSYDKTTSTETGQKLTGDIWSHGEQYESNRKTEDVEEFCKFYDDLAKNWKEKQEKILDAYIDVTFSKNGSADLRLPWMFHDDGDGSYTKFLVTKNHDTGGWEEHRSKVSKEQAINDTKEYLRKMDVSIRPSSPGCVEVSYEGATSDDTMNLWGDHSIDLEELDMKTLKSRVKYLSING